LAAVPGCSCISPRAPPSWPSLELLKTIEINFVTKTPLRGEFSFFLRVTKVSLSAAIIICPSDFFQRGSGPVKRRAAPDETRTRQSRQSRGSHASQEAVAESKRQELSTSAGQQASPWWAEDGEMGLSEGRSAKR